MKTITFYLDFVSPYAWLAFEQLPKTLEGISCHVQYRPVLLGALLQRSGNPGPPGIPGKHAWVCRHAAWLGQSLGCGLHLPARHPFNPLPLLRLALECSHDGSINRFVGEAILRHVWLGQGADALDAARLAALREHLAPQLRPDGLERAKQLLRENTEAAAARPIFGVPSLVLDGKVFWGLEGLPMLRACLLGEAWFDGPWEAAGSVPSGLDEARQP